MSTSQAIGLGLLFAATQGLCMWFGVKLGMRLSSKFTSSILRGCPRCMNRLRRAAGVQEEPEPQ